MMDLQTAPQVIEAILFVAGEPVKIADLAIALGLDDKQIAEAVDATVRSFENEKKCDKNI